MDLHERGYNSIENARLVNLKKGNHVETNAYGHKRSNRNQTGGSTAS